jgi:hypothetical protein
MKFFLIFFAAFPCARSLVEIHGDCPRVKRNEIWNIVDTQIALNYYATRY